MQLDDLYRDVLFDHYKSPRRKRDLSALPEACTAENPSCGDSVTVSVSVTEDGRIDAVFDGRGCAVSMASASMMCDRLSGMTPEEAKREIALFLDIMRGKEPAERLEQMGDLAALSGIPQFPVRIKCATLSWHALSDRLSELESADSE